jgi:V8-like Glu-specific endopeptidase
MQGVLSRSGKKLIATKSMKIGEPNLPQSSVRFGDEAPEYHYVVGISYLGPRGSATCTGTLMSETLVLTAAHCACGSNYKVTQDMRMVGAKFIPVDGPPILFDEEMCRRGRIRPGHDLALLQLKEKAKGIKPLYDPMPKLAVETLAATRTGKALMVIGYGLTERQTLGVRMQALVPVFTPDCRRMQYIAAGCAPFLEMILSASGQSGIRQGTDTCGGDSGGPVFAIVPKGDGLVPSLIAVTSRQAPIPHADGENHCGGGGFYTVLGRKDVRLWLAANGVEDKPE